MTSQFIALRFRSYLVDLIELNRKRSLSYTEDSVSEDRTKMAWKSDARMGSYFFSDPKYISTTHLPCNSLTHVWTYYQKYR